MKKLFLSVTIMLFALPAFSQHCIRESYLPSDVKQFAVQTLINNCPLIDATASVIKIDSVGYRSWDQEVYYNVHFQNQNLSNPYSVNVEVAYECNLRRLDLWLEKFIIEYGCK